KKEGAISGPILGGNMSVVCSLLGTPYVSMPKDAILFFEDIDERGYSVDRMLTQLTQVGWFDEAKAVIFGQFTGGQEADGRQLAPKVIQRFAQSASCPVFSGLPSGHDDENRVLPLNTRGWLNPGKNPALRVETGVDGE
ncbi:MAG: LD-carboxypeptidase, partial [Alphaproteobacteria bacterium]|nr:LD-carboxypeptidase [Alphaproteobacteria bacterium]